MSFRNFARSLEPDRFLPGDNIDFDGTVEDIVTFTYSEPFDGELLQDSGVLSEDYSLEIVTSPLQVLQNIKPYGVIAFAISIPAGSTGNVFVAGDETVSVSNAAGLSTVTVGTATSPGFPEGTWHMLVLQGTTWTVQQLTTETTVELKLQNILVFPSLTVQEIEDLIAVAQTARITRSVDDAGVAINDLGTTTISADWHIISV